MSIWAEIHKRSNGITMSQEDFNQIYGEREKPEFLYSEEYNGCELRIYTNGHYPYVELIFVSPQMSIFSGKDLVKLKDEDGKYYDLTRNFDIKSGKTEFSFWFNRDDDYVGGDKDDSTRITKPHDGIKYSLEDLKRIARKFADLIIRCEDDLTNHMD